MNQPKVPIAHRGVTLLELLIVLTVMGIAAALVVPMLTPATPRPTSATETIVARARQLAVSRAEGLRVQIGSDGAWKIRVAQSGIAVDSGAARGDAAGPGAPRDFVVDALGSCIPVQSSVTTRAVDPLSCDVIPPPVTP